MIVLKQEDMVNKCFDCGGMLIEVYDKEGKLLSLSNDDLIQWTAKCRACGKKWLYSMDVEEV